jgi:hypothetical protein
MEGRKEKYGVGTACQCNGTDTDVLREQVLIFAELSVGKTIQMSRT